MPELPRLVRWSGLLLRRGLTLARLWRLLGAASERLARLPLDQAEAELAAGSAVRLGEVSPDELARLLRVAGRLRRQAGTCLPRALCLKLLLERQGRRPELRLGVRRASDRLEAHAWVELGGRPVGEAADVLERFSPLESPAAWAAALSAK